MRAAISPWRSSWDDLSRLRVARRIVFGGLEGGKMLQDAAGERGLDPQQLERG
jgi:hypothetical protein